MDGSPPFLKAELRLFFFFASKRKNRQTITKKNKTKNLNVPKERRPWLSKDQFLTDCTARLGAVQDVATLEEALKRP